MRNESARNGSNLEYRLIAHGSAEYKECVNLRYRVLREPLGLVFSVEQLEKEAADFHLALYKAGELAACLVLVPGVGQQIVMRQVAVSPQMQRQGIGRALVEFAENVARQKGFARIVLHARETAVPFYEGLGYERVGARFEEITLPHWEMVKEIDPLSN